jgi:hypothetical protein
LTFVGGLQRGHFGVLRLRRGGDAERGLSEARVVLRFGVARLLLGRDRPDMGIDQRQLGVQFGLDLGDLDIGLGLDLQM